MINRRQFLASTTIAALARRAPLASAESEQRWEPDGVGSLARLGVLTPDDDPVPESEMRMMAPDGVSIHASRVLWKSGDARSFAGGAASAAQLLVRLKPRLILYAFTSSSYVLGEDADGRLRAEIEKRAGGIKVLFTCPAAVEALHLLGARRVALIHPPWFGEELNAKGKDYFQGRGFDVLSCVSLAPARVVRQVVSVTQQTLPGTDDQARAGARDLT
jgi:maleate isomerase